MAQQTEQASSSRQATRWGQAGGLKRGIAVGRDPFSRCRREELAAELYSSAVSAAAGHTGASAQRV
jgi:hypothetical protein